MFINVTTVDPSHCPSSVESIYPLLLSSLLLFAGIVGAMKYKMREKRGSKPFQDERVHEKVLTRVEALKQIG